MSGGAPELDEESLADVHAQVRSVFDDAIERGVPTVEAMQLASDAGAEFVRQWLLARQT